MSAKPDYHVWDQRTDGLRDTIREAGFDIDSRNVIQPGDCHAVDGERAMKELLASGRPLPTAIFCHTDEMEFGAMAVLRGADTTARWRSPLKPRGGCIERLGSTARQGPRSAATFPSG